jgi:hypothetical protein
MVMSPAGPRSKNDCAGEDKHQFTQTKMNCAGECRQQFTKKDGQREERE